MTKQKTWKGKDSHIRHAKDGTPSQVRPHRQRYAKEPLKRRIKYNDAYFARMQRGTYWQTDELKRLDAELERRVNRERSFRGIDHYIALYKGFLYMMKVNHFRGWWDIPEYIKKELPENLLGGDKSILEDRAINWGIDKKAEKISEEIYRKVTRIEDSAYERRITKSQEVTEYKILYYNLRKKYKFETLPVPIWYFMEDHKLRVGAKVFKSMEVRGSSDYVGPPKIRIKRKRSS